MVSMKKVYCIGVTNDRIIEGELVPNCKILQQINTSEGPVYVPSMIKLWENKSEMMTVTFANCYKNGMDIDTMIDRFQLDRQEAQGYLENALKKFPEKFI